MVLDRLRKTAGRHIGHVPADPNPFVAFTLLLQIVIGFFATAGAAGADFGMNSRNASGRPEGRLGRHCPGDPRTPAGCRSCPLPVRGC